MADAEERAAVERQSGGRVSLFLRIGDFEVASARLKAVGVSFEETPRREPCGTVAVWRDSWGHRWDLLGP